MRFRTARRMQRFWRWPSGWMKNWRPYERISVRLFRFHSQLWLATPREKVFDFFSDARNLEDLTPQWLQFRILTPLPIEMREGAEIEYRLRIHGFPARWKSEISHWEPPNRFVDVQLSGPYRRWIHEHTFKDANGGTLCEDAVDYAPLGGALVNKLLVEKDVKKIFDFRSQRLREIFAGSQP